jgi:uncharacterized protein with PIN domain
MNPKIKFYTDEHIPKAVIQGLRRRGIDILSVPESGMLEASDEEILDRALIENRIIITQDDDFLRLHSEGKKHSGIVYSPHGTSIGEMISGLMLIHQLLDSEEMKNHVEFL